MKKDTAIKTVENKSLTQKAADLVLMEAQLKDLKQKVADYKAELLKATQELDVLTLKTGSYTIVRAKRITPQVANFKELKKSLDLAEIPYTTTEVFSDYMKPVFRQLVDDGKLLPGLEVLETEYISIRVPDKK